MERQESKKESTLKVIAFKHISKFIKWLDAAVFKIVVDYIVRNFDPTEINIWGLFDSLYYVLLKRKLSTGNTKDKNEFKVDYRFLKTRG